MSSLLAQVTRGRVSKPFNIVIYGPPGTGKSTFGADAPSAIFLGAEDGSSHLDVSRLPQPKSLADCMAAFRELTTEAHDFRTLVVDSLDWIEPLVHREVCQKAGVSNIEEIGYGKGHVAATKLWQDVIGAMHELREKRSMNLILIAHAQVKSVFDPKENKNYDRYAPKLHEKATALFTEFSDAILFATYEVFYRQDQSGRTQAISSGARVMHTEWRPGFVAKNRYGLPFTLPLSFEAFSAALKAGQPESIEVLKRQLEALIPQVKDEAIKARATEVLKSTDATKLAKAVNTLETLAANQK